MEAWAPELDDVAAMSPLGGSDGLDVAALAARIAQRLGDAPLRVGESAVVMGVASRLWSVSVVPFVLDGVLPDASDLLVRDDDGAVVLGLGLRQAWATTDVDELADWVFGVLRPMVDALPLAPRLLWGNVAASLAAVPRVQRLPSARPVVEDLLGRAPLAGELHEVAGVVRRRTCCLFYEVAGAGLCGDCVFTTVPGRGHTSQRQS